MAILNSSVNFIVYVLASRKFRHDLFALVRGAVRCRLGVGWRPGPGDARGQRANSQDMTVVNRVSIVDFGDCAAAAVVEQTEDADDAV